MFVKKIINKESLNDTTKAMARQECVIQSQMDHKNIIKLHKFAESSSTIELIMDYCSNGSYFEDRLEEVRKLKVHQSDIFPPEIVSFVYIQVSTYNLYLEFRAN